MYRWCSCQISKPLKSKQINQPLQNSRKSSNRKTKPLKSKQTADKPTIAKLRKSSNWKKKCNKEHVQITCLPKTSTIKVGRVKSCIRCNYDTWISWLLLWSSWNKHWILRSSNTRNRMKYSIAVYWPFHEKNVCTTCTN